MNLPASTPPARLSVATSDVLPSQPGNVVVDEDHLDATVDSLLQRVLHVGARRRDDDRLHALGDHRLDRGDLTLVVGAAGALGEDQLDLGWSLFHVFAASTIVS